MRCEFSKVGKIDVGDCASWAQPLFLTFDIDWASDDVLADAIDLVERADVAATWFVTHDTVLLSRLRDNPKFELGVHPNFNFLLEGDLRAGRNAAEVIDRIMHIVPEARSVRSHSMTQTSRLLDLFAAAGLRVDCNHFIPEQAGIALKPWTHWNGITRAPYFWEDDVALLYDQGIAVETLAQAVGVKIFDFHPIHIFLNTENLDRYERTRPLHGSAAQLVRQRFDGAGTRTHLQGLLEMAK